MSNNTNTQTPAEQIWNAIKSTPINLFGLPNQFVSQHCAPVSVEPSKLYLVSRSSALLPALEAALAPKFSVELADKWIIVQPVLSK